MKWGNGWEILVWKNLLEFRFGGELGWKFELLFFEIEMILKGCLFVGMMKILGEMKWLLMCR